MYDRIPLVLPGDSIFTHGRVAPPLNFGVTGPDSSSGQMAHTPSYDGLYVQISLRQLPMSFMSVDIFKIPDSNVTINNTLISKRIEKRQANNKQSVIATYHTIGGCYSNSILLNELLMKTINSI